MCFLMSHVPLKPQGEATCKLAREIEVLNIMKHFWLVRLR